MDANRFFSIPYDNRNDVKMRRLRKRLGGYAGYGRWVALLGMLYDEKGILDMNDQEMREIVAEELDLDDVDMFFDELSMLGLIDRELYASMSHVVNHGVCDEIEYRRKKSEAGRKGMAKRWGKEEK
jgi:hypothetical protein